MNERDEWRSLLAPAGGAEHHIQKMCNFAITLDTVTLAERLPLVMEREYLYHYYNGMSTAEMTAEATKVCKTVRRK